LTLWHLPWFLLGLVALGLGMAGLVLPLLPTTPFLLLAAWGFSRSSPRFHSWLIGHPRLGPPILDWQTHRAISRRAKGIAMIAIAATPLVSLGLGVPGAVIAIQIVVLTAVSAFILTRPEPPPQHGRAARGATAPIRPPT
jgi:uncharacterized membrane protein YbaN (DUF454 family)